MKTSCGTSCPRLLLSRRPLSRNGILRCPCWLQYTRLPWHCLWLTGCSCSEHVGSATLPCTCRSPAWSLTRNVVFGRRTWNKRTEESRYVCASTWSSSGRTVKAFRSNVCVGGVNTATFDKEKEYKGVRFEIFTVVTMKNGVFWDIKTQSVLRRRHITSPLQSPAS
jgi:hypothetical protein